MEMPFMILELQPCVGIAACAPWQGSGKGYRPCWALCNQAVQSSLLPWGHLIAGLRTKATDKKYQKGQIQLILTVPGQG